MSNLKDDGGPAFPTLEHLNSLSPVPVTYWGMSLRDWFAGQALARYTCNDLHAAKLAEWAYADADAMLAERAKVRP